MSGIELITKLYFKPDTLSFLKSPVFKGINFIDYWSFIHFFSGFFLVLIPFVGKGNYKLVFVILVVYEIFELFLLGQGLLIQERLLNILWDLIIGMLGYYVGNLLL